MKPADLQNEVEAKPNEAGFLLAKIRVNLI